jgi:TetR/AcrR family transcriptional regulator
MLDKEELSPFLTKKIVKLNSWLTMTQKHPKDIQDKPNRAADDTRAKILDAALYEFSRFGLAGARVDRISRRAKVNKAMLYYHFSSKKELHGETIRYHFSSLLNQAGQATDVPGRLEDILEKLLDIYMTTFSRKPELPRILLRELADAESKSINLMAKVVAKSGLPEHIMKSFRAGIKEGRLRNVDVRQALVSFMLMNIGYFMLAPLVDKVWGITDRKRFIADRRRSVIDLFLHGVELP